MYAIRSYYAIQDGLDRGPLKVHPYADTASTNGVKDVSGNYQATLTVTDDAGQTHTAMKNFALSGAVSYAIEDCDATCSIASGNSNQVRITSYNVCYTKLLRVICAVVLLGIFSGSGWYCAQPVSTSSKPLRPTSSLLFPRLMPLPPASALIHPC